MCFGQNKLSIYMVGIVAATMHGLQSSPAITNELGIRWLLYMQLYSLANNLGTVAHHHVDSGLLEWRPYLVGS